MQNIDWNKYIKKSHEQYKSIGSVPCPAFNNELILFNKYGWTHLLRKGKDIRNRDEQARRINLLLHASIIINKSTEYSEYRKNFLDGTIGHFWSLRKNILNKKLKVVIRQLDNGPKHFFSIMSE